MCDVIKTCLKRRIVTKSGTGTQPLNIKTAVERPILKLGLYYKAFIYILFNISLHPSLLDVFL